MAQADNNFYQKWNRHTTMMMLFTGKSQCVTQEKHTSLRISGGNPVASNVINGAGTFSPWIFSRNIGWHMTKLYRNQGVKHETLIQKITR
jgi:hydroxyethylthiazole kinase-like sugar kinase family protein